MKTTRKLTDGVKWQRGWPRDLLQQGKLFGLFEETWDSQSIVSTICFKIEWFAPWEGPKDLRRENFLVFRQQRAHLACGASAAHRCYLYIPTLWNRRAMSNRSACVVKNLGPCGDNRRPPSPPVFRPIFPESDDRISHHLRSNCRIGPIRANCRRPLNAHSFVRILGRASTARAALSRT